MPRLFFALSPDEGVRDNLYRVAEAAQASSGGRLMRRENLHQTLVFIGSLDAKRVASVEAAASEARAALHTLLRHRRLLAPQPHCVGSAFNNARTVGATRDGARTRSL